MTSQFTASVRVPASERSAREGAAMAVAVIDLDGQLDGAAEAQMEQVYTDAIGDGIAAMVLDFGRVTYINSTGIALLVGLLARARTDDVEVGVCGLSDHYRHIFEITRLADFLTFFDDESAALAATPTPLNR
ncbi:STAS domain-containing protein [Nitriliruptor alkaliphilus]|uniref:STAS domain-containing protein n=1 Tax=Nitriliruptor alkaliphilus TaxID=427918 RepID=UPI000696F191|nr:STAS domain-containing protein [Nitriliruptor alkaliphilus]